MDCVHGGDEVDETSDGEGALRGTKYFRFDSSEAGHSNRTLESTKQRTTASTKFILNIYEAFRPIKTLIVYS